MYKVEFEISGQPQGKARPRFTKTGRAYTPEKTKIYEQRIQAAAWAAMKKDDLQTVSCPVHMEIVAFMQIPKSWSKVKRLEAEYGAIRPTVKPDLDNIIKAVGDGCNEIVYQDDKQIHSVKARKVYCHPDRGPVLYVAFSWTDKFPE